MARDRAATPPPRTTGAAAAAASDSTSPITDKKGPPSASLILVVYIILGALLSFGTGRNPGDLPSKKDIFPVVAALCLFVVFYNLWDVLGVGIVKSKAGFHHMTYEQMPAKVPEPVFLAERAQMNQVEQFASIVVASVAFAGVVNGLVAAGLCSFWILLRFGYTRSYRRSVGGTFMEKSLGRFTVPCYFIINAMAMGTAIHVGRFFLKDAGYIS